MNFSASTTRIETPERRTTSESRKPNRNVRLSGAAYFFRGALGIPDYWHPIPAVRPEAFGSIEGPYPFSFAEKADFRGDFADGIPYVVSHGRAIAAPVLVLQYGLGCYERYRDTGDPGYRARFEDIVGWAERNTTELGDGTGWANDYDYAMYGISAPWFSGMVQGLGLALLAKACALGIDRRELMRAVHRGFRTPVDNRGFARPYEGGLVYEEYPAPGLNFVFNGMCHALLGLWEADRCGVEGAAADFEAGVTALRRSIHRFDRQLGWSLYSLDTQHGAPLLATCYYQRANGVLAEIMARVTGDSEFARYGSRWRAAAANVPIRLANSFRMGWQRLASSRVRRFIVHR